jgi:hypothetical protein
MEEIECGESLVDLEDRQLSLGLLDLWHQASSKVLELECGQMSIETGVGSRRYRFAGSKRFVHRCRRVVDDIWMAAAATNEPAPRMTFQDWASLAWYHVVESHNLDHLQAGARVEWVRTWGGVMAYCAKYLAKSDCGFMEEQPLGRSWGIFNRAAIPWAKIVELNLDNEVGVRLRRVARRYLEHRLGRRVRAPYGITVYCDPMQFRRLWEGPPCDPF